ncbi:MAG TPA: helix-turn-helix domain-containing protein [Candidatus Nitrosotenuis sp.]|nr:helix-turn-helix domain-containing protein [Candidatus Nitrosotenuis sp.]
MARGYQQDYVQQKLIEILSESKTGLSGIEIAEKLGINRATMAKYLNVFAAEGLIRQKNIGNANLWFIDSATERLEFPADYFHAKEKFLEYLSGGLSQKAYQLIRNCQYSGASTQKIVSEVILPAISAIEDMYLKAKIGKSESKLFGQIVTNSLRILSLAQNDFDPKKNVLVFAADPQSELYSHAAACVFGSLGWQTMDLGDMSDAIDVLYELDLQKFLAKTWRQKQSIMVIVVFCATEEGAKFFSESINSVRPKFGKNLHTAIYSKAKNIKAEFVSDSFDGIIQWVDSMAATVS